MVLAHYKCEVVHTKAHVNTPDGGIDLLVGHDTTKVLAAVQARRKKNNGHVGVSQVREFVGALTIQGHQKGIFVTTAEKFTDPVYKEQRLLHENSRIELDLVNSARLRGVKC